MNSVWAIGLMSGTSMDGIDAALVKTDGTRITEFGPALSVPYAPDFQQEFRGCLGQKTAPQTLVDEFTDLNVVAVRSLLAGAALAPEDISVVGFHGQTLFHDAPNGITVQVGNGQYLAEQTGINVVSDFRSADVAAGGQGAPLAPLYHQALAKDMHGPIAILNLGGVGNVTYINGADLLAFDTGPANALIDDWVRKKTGAVFDKDGRIAARGQVDEDVLHRLLDHPYFEQEPPKSLDRNDFSKAAVAGLSIEDGAATLSEFTVRTVTKSLIFMKKNPVRWLVTGGGRKNGFLMQRLARLLDVPVVPVEEAGWRGDELEAEAFAYLAVRSVYGLPLSLPTTTGVRAPVCGGHLHRPCGRRPQL